VCRRLVQKRAELNDLMPLPFAELVSTSQAVASVGGRLEKIERLASLLSRLEPDEIAIAVAFLTGSLRQGRLGIGGAAIREARLSPPAASSALTLTEVDAVFARMASLGGA